MAKDGRTEKATPKKRKDARKKGQVLKSKEFSNMMSFCTLLIGVVFFGTNVVTTFFRLMLAMFEHLRRNSDPSILLKAMIEESAPLLVGSLLLYLLFTLLSSFSQVGFLFSAESIKPSFKKINPANYFKQLGNLKKSFFELAKNFIIFIIFILIVYNVFLTNEKTIEELILVPWFDSIKEFQSIINELLIKLAIAIFLIGIIDYFFEKYQYEDNLKMKKQEVKDEHKQYQTNPEVKAKQRQHFKTLLEKKVRKSVPDASAIIVNPTHYAVAIRYKKSKGDVVPVVLTKGVDHLALYIKEIARENNIPIIENKPLARRMYSEIDEGEEIPQDLYKVVGAILAKLAKEKRISIK